LFRKILIAIIRGYQGGISVWTPPTCRFVPTCSEYAIEVIQSHGAARGIWLALRRIGRCHPWGDFGPDPVPPRVEMNSAERACVTERVR